MDLELLLHSLQLVNNHPIVLGYILMISTIAIVTTTHAHSTKFRVKGIKRKNGHEATKPNTKKSVTVSHHKKMLNHYTFLMAMKLVAIQVMARFRDNRICLTGQVNTAFFLLGCVCRYGTCAC